MGWWYIDSCQNIARYVFKSSWSCDVPQLVGSYFPRGEKSIIEITISFLPVGTKGKLIQGHTSLV